ncbi:hypothetical protein HFO72_12955 [Rhizobium laguerreae]|uniref:three component ABC system middle component n=1 Tax=Rhizobium laguerreae TaxID=1076926 RepID=UPI001C905A3D|nr:three component ABC system middle component [Rhizobium laguerreae]MBY3091707.1 hypothetical protein [Rhizobium laguerreae]
MKSWHQRPIEIRNLFNPAFCGLILSRAMTGYEEDDNCGIPFSLALLILPLCLHKETRSILAKGSRSYFLRAVETHPEMLIGFPRRTTDMMSYTFEALGLLMKLGCFEVTETGRLKSIEKRVRKSVIGTPESVEIQRVARFVGKEFARISDRVTLYTSLGIKP